jgi:hypothetical protein
LDFAAADLIFVKLEGNVGDGHVSDARNGTLPRRTHSAQERGL